MLPNHSGLRMRLSLLASVLALVLMFVAPVMAEEAQFYQGEPTDPEKVLVTVTENSDDLERQGVDLTPPEDTTEFDAWYDAMLDLLRALGLLPSEDSPQ